MTALYLMTNLKTSRNGKKVTLPANTTQNLTADEVSLLDALTKSTGRPHYREPRNETAQVFHDDDLGDGGLDLSGIGRGNDSGDDGDNGGKTPEPIKPLDEMTVKELKAYLDAEPKAAYPATADKAALLTLAEAKAEAVDENGGL